MILSGSKRRSARASACALLTCLLVASVASPYPDEYAPFDGKGPAVFRTYPCRLVRSGPDKALTYVRGDSRKASARMRITRSSGQDSGSVFMSVVDVAGRIIGGPQRIADSAVVIPPAFWADLSGDGREDFIALVVTAIGRAACECDVGFALSSDSGYRITGVRSTRGPGANDFLDLGKGRVGFIHTALISRRDPARPKAMPENFFVYSMLEVKGDRLVLSKADPRFAGFPKWVPLASGPRPAAAPTLAEAERARLWSDVAGRIIRGSEVDRPPEIASATE